MTFQWNFKKAVFYKARSFDHSVELITLMISIFLTTYHILNRCCHDVLLLAPLQTSLCDSSSVTFTSTSHPNHWLITAFWQMPFKHTFSPWLVFPNFKQCSPISDLIPFFIFALLAFFFLALREVQTKNAHFQILHLLFTTSAKSSPSTKSKNVVILSFISVLPVKLWPHYAPYQLCLCPKIRPWNPFPHVKLHLTLAVSCVWTIYYCKQFEIPRTASCKSH